MSNFINKTKGWQAVNRDIIQDNNLTDRARFLYVYMASKPDDWNFFHSAMCKELGYEEDTLRKYLKELQEYGLLIVGEQSNNGKFGAVEYTLLDRLPENPCRKISDTEKNRYGKNPTQRDKDIITNKDYKENKDFKEKKDISDEISKKATNDIDQAIKEFKDEALKDKELAYCLRSYRIKDMNALLDAFISHVIKQARIKDIKEKGYINAKSWLLYSLPHLDLSKATGVRLGVEEYLDDDGNRYYVNQRSGAKIIVPDDAPPRPSKNHIWARSEGCWITN